ncbi:MAG: zinc-finger domain-containing protein [Pseudomonadota bacterium]
MSENATESDFEMPETEIVSKWRISCDGGEGALGHPRVWLSISPDRGWVVCGYCDKRYVHESFAEAE